MPLSPEHRAALVDFPAALRRLVEAEVAAGNRIVEIVSTFPAPPVGACVRLGARVTTRQRASGEGLDFYERNSSLHSGEWTDSRRFHFVLEPPVDPAALPPAVSVAPPAQRRRAKRRRAAVADLRRPDGAVVGADGALARFRASMVLDHDKWHDGAGYDLAALRSLSPAERAVVEAELIGRATTDWRDVEALAVLGTPAAAGALRRALATGGAEIRTAVLRHAPECATQEEKTTALVAALGSADAFAGLDATLRAIEDHHPPAVLEAMLRAVEGGPRVAASHYAGLLLFLHGRASEPFAAEERPFLLRFATDEPGARREAVAELRRRCGWPLD